MSHYISPLPAMLCLSHAAVQVVHKYGADALRLYLIDSPVVRGDPLKFKVRASAPRRLLPAGRPFCPVVTCVNHACEACMRLCFRVRGVVRAYEDLIYSLIFSDCLRVAARVGLTTNLTAI